MGIKPDKYFILRNGTVIRDLFELSKALSEMPDDIFSHHVNPERNDFSNWVKDVVKDKYLAGKMLDASNRKDMQKIIGDKIQKNVIKSMNKPAKPKKEVKKAKVEKTKTTKAKPTKPEESIADKLMNLFARKESKSGKSHPHIDPKNIKFGINCPYKTFQCGVLEFVFGLIIGLLIALVLTSVL